MIAAVLALAGSIVLSALGLSWRLGGIAQAVRDLSYRVGRLENHEDDERRDAGAYRIFTAPTELGIAASVVPHR